MHDVFVSYKNEDRARVKPLVDALTADGLSVWWDVHIEGGAAWREVIAAKLDAAACVLVVWSHNSVSAAGRFVQDEATRADRRGVYLPIAIDAVQPPLGFGQQQMLPLLGWHGNRHAPHYVDILAAIRGIVEGGPRPVPIAPTWVAGRMTTPRWRLPLLAGVAALTLVAGATVVLAPAQLCTRLGLACAIGAKHAPANSIAVLPFANISGDPAQEYFSDGLSEELMSKLARLDKLQVAARTSSFKFKGSKDSTASIAGKLGVAYLLDGSVRREGNVVRVSTQLVEGTTGFERWSQSYDRDMKDIFAVQSGIAEAVADALQVKLLGDDIAAMSRGGTKDPAAWDAYLRGRRLFDASGDATQYRAALDQFDAAIARDPGFAAAHSARARALLALANQFTADVTVMHRTYNKALVSAQHAVSLAPTLTDSNVTLALVTLYGRQDFTAAGAAYAKAIKTGGGDADTLARYGIFSVWSGATATGLAALQRATLLDPLNPRVWKTLGIAQRLARNYAAAIAAQRQALALNPQISGAHAEIGHCLLLQGQFAVAKAEFALEPLDWERWTGQAIVLHRLGDTAAAAAALKALIASGGDSKAYQQALIRAQWGEPAASLAALDAAFAIGDSGVLYMNTDPLLDPLRDLPAFKAQILHLRLPAAQP